MEEEDVIESPQVDAPEQEEQGPGPSLSDEDRKKLAGVILKMKADKQPIEKIKLVAQAFAKKYGQQSQDTAIQKVDYSQVPKPTNATESIATPMQAKKQEIANQQSNDPTIVANRKKYNDLRDQTIKDIEGGEWKDQIFKGKKPALTEDQLPEESYKAPDSKAIEQYLDTRGLNNSDRYWLRNQIVSYGKQRQNQASIDQLMRNNIKDIPEVKAAQDKANEAVIHGLIKPEEYDAMWKSEVANKPELETQLSNAYNKSALQQDQHETSMVATRLNNIGLDDKPISVNAPFHDQITGANKALMGVLNFSGDVGQQMSSLLELANVPGLSDIGYKLKIDADNLKGRNFIPHTGEAGNVLAGEIVPMALDMEALRRLSGAAGKPLYQALGRAKQAGRIGQFMEGAIGGLAISPANSYIIAHQYYNDLVKQGMTPDEAGHKSDQLLLKNMTTDLFVTPLQMGLMKMGGGWKTKALEAPVSGAHFTIQDFNQKSVENPALSIANYLHSDPDAGKTFWTGAALGLMQKAAVDAMHNWDVRSGTKRMFDYNRQYGGDRKGLPTNNSIANNVLTAIEMKDTPGRPNELKDLVTAMHESGTYSTEEKNVLHDIIDDVTAVRKQVPKFGTSFQRIAVMNELLNQRSAEKYIPMAGESGAKKLPEEAIKESNERIQRIMSNQEPLYFVNGNETSKEQLEDAIEKDPSLLKKKGFRIDVKNDSEFIKNLKNKYNAVQKQEPTTDDVRNTPANSEKVGGRNEGEGSVDQSASGKERRTNFNSLKEGDKVIWDVYGNEHAGEWMVGKKVKTRGGKDAVELYKTVTGEDGLTSTLTHTVIEEDFNNSMRTNPIDQSNNILEARHSITDHDEEGIVSGQNDRPLSDEGVALAGKLGEDIRAKHNVTKIITSDLGRASQTAHIVSEGDIPVEERPELRSWDLKDFGGMKDDEFREIQKWFAENPDETKYDGPVESAKGKAIGESLNDYAKRVIEARQAIEKEGPGTLVINHSNNMMIWDAFKENGGIWDKEAINDYMSRPTPEAAALREEEPPEQTLDETNKKIESGEISDEEIKSGAKLFIQYEKGGPLPFPELPASNEQEAGNTQPDGSSRQYAKATRAPQPVPSSGGQTPPGQNQSGQPVPGGASPPDTVRLTKSAKYLINEGRTDDQVMTYLQRKGMDPQEALAALGEAKANPINQNVKDQSIEEAIKKYNPKEDLWLGEKELNKINAQQTTREYQKEIRNSVKNDHGQKGFSWKDVDRAIHIYLDTQRNPSHFSKYYPKLSPEQKKIADLSQKLNPDQIRIADAIRDEYDVIGEWAKQNGVIKDLVDNYVARAWEFKGKAATEENFKFNTSTRHSLQRTLDTILQGYAEGMKLKTEGATNNFLILRQEIGNVIENKKLLEEGLSVRYNSGEVDNKGKTIMKPLFTTKTDEPGYVRVENRAFRKWEYAGKLDDYTADQRKFFGRDTMVTEEGTVLQKRDVYAPEEVAKSLNNIMGKNKIQSDVIKDIAKFNALVKQSILSLSGFHFIAFTRAHALSAKYEKAADINPIAAFRGGLKMLADQNVHGQELIRHGMTINRQPEWDEGVLHHQTLLGKQLDKLAFTKVIKDKMLNLNEQFHKLLFNTYGAGLKMFDGVQLAKSELAKNPTSDPKEVYARVAKLMNDTYGGINWDRMRGTRMQNPGNRRVASLLLLAPDWTASNLRMAKKAFERGDEGGLYRKAWGRVILRGVMATGIANAIMAVWDDKDDEGNSLSWPDAMKRRLEKGWESGKLRSTMIDITPLYRAIGGSSEKRAYFSVFGAYTDPYKMLKDPIDFLEHKGSYITKVPLEALTSQNWQGREFTTLDEFLGMDDKGTYAKTTGSHLKGEINPNTGLPYKKTQVGHEEGDKKGGKHKGDLTKWPEGGGHAITWAQTPSFIMNEVRGMMPGAISNAWQVAAGENDITTGILNTIGSNILTNKEPKKKDE